jgi:hypothetical protein
VRTVYLAPGAGDETLMAYLADAGVYLIGSGPPPDELRDHWIASVRADYVRVLSDSLASLAGWRGGFTLPVSIVVEDINQELFSPGRQLLVENLLPDLLNGFIDTGEDPKIVRMINCRIPPLMRSVDKIKILKLSSPNLRFILPMNTIRVILPFNDWLMI